MDELENRIIELEIRLALQDELVGSLNDTVAKMQNTLDSQQSQLRLLYNKIQQQSEGAGDKPDTLAAAVPPPY